MKAFSIILAITVFLAFGSPLLVQGAQVTRVSPEKFKKLTPAQKEKFKEIGRSAQDAAEKSTSDYNEVEKEATDAKNVAETIRDIAIDVGKAALGAKVLPKR